MSQRFPADRTLVDQQRKIIDPWLGPLKRLEPLLPLLTPEFIATLQAVIKAAQSPEEEQEQQVVKAFSNVLAYNEASEVSGGVITALQASDILSILVSGNASFASDPSNRALSLQIGGHYYLPTGTSSVALSNLGVSATSGITTSGNRIYVAPFQVPSARTLSALEFLADSNPVGGGNCAMAIYGDAGSRPGIQLATGTVSSGTSSGTKTVNIDITLPAGPYWLAFHPANNTNVQGVSDIDGCLGARSSDLARVRGFSRNTSWNGLLADETSSTWSAEFSTMPVVCIS
jgi:hypothetical protein